MKSSQNSPFSYLLSVYKIKLGTISEDLFVSKTLVSKWKHGERKIGAYAKRLAEFFYEYDKKNEAGCLMPILSKTFPLRESGSKDSAVALLADWLSSAAKTSSAINAPDADFSSVYHAFFGRQGLIKAINFLADNISKDCCDYFYCLNAGNIEWFTGDKLFQNSWITVLENLFINKEIKMRLINRMDWRVSDIKDIVETMLYWDILGKIDSVFYTGRAGYCGDSFVILIPGVAMLKLAYDTSVADNLFCSMVFDKYTLERQFRECERLYNEGGRLMEHNIFKKDITLKHCLGQSFISSNSFPLLPADIYALKSECNLMDEQVQNALEKYPALFNSSSETCYLLRREGLINALKAESLYCAVLSAIFEKDIVVSRKFLIESGRRLYKEVLDGGGELFILDDKDYFPRLNVILNNKYAFCTTQEHNGFFDDTHLTDFMNAYYVAKYDELVCGGSSQKYITEFIGLLEKV